MPQRLLQGSFEFPGYPVPDRLRNLDPIRASVVGLAFRRLHEIEQTLRPAQPSDGGTAKLSPQAQVSGKLSTISSGSSTRIGVDPE